MAGQRAYEKSHPWLTFHVNLRNADPRIWLLLGEAQSKCFHMAGVPLMPDVADEFYLLALTKGALGTTAIEGNTLTEDEVRKRILGKLELPPSRSYLGVEVDNIVSACNDIARTINRTGPLTVGDIKRYNEKVLNKLTIEDGKPGELRDGSVVVARYRGAPAQDCEFLLENLCKMLNEKSFQPEPGKEIIIGLLKAIIAHLYFVWIHPFYDGNGRTARLIEFRILLQAGVPETLAHMLSNHYNMTREQYYKELDRTSRDEYDIMGFIRYAIQGFVDNATDQLKRVRLIQWDLCWKNFIYDKFRGKNTPAMIRRRHLMLDISDLPDSKVEISKVTTVTPRLALEYAGKQPKTVTRDINYLLRLKLVKREGRMLKVERRQILAFLPKSAIGIKNLL